MWTLPEAQTLILTLQGESRQYGFHITLGGSVLNVGHSEKDLDLFLLPMDNSKIKEDRPGLLKMLRDNLGDSEELRGIAYEMRIHKEMIKFDVCGKRVDVFIL